MEWAKIKVIGPDNELYEAEVDLQARDEAILDGLVRGIGLPRMDENNRPIKYHLSTVGATRLLEGGTIKIELEEPLAVRKVTPASGRSGNR